MLMLFLNESIDQLAILNNVCWYGHVLRREDGHVLRRELYLEFVSLKRKGWSNNISLECVVI